MNAAEETLISPEAVIALNAFVMRFSSCDHLVQLPEAVNDKRLFCNKLLEMCVLLLQCNDLPARSGICLLHSVDSLSFPFIVCR